ncbi:hypothetical protein H3146_05980 [Streptomyces sp. OF3]|uniref:Uncharacterized protein n=1 Tax=Streptomyces alkaliterrae TaxID=2213162 RepID=A0A7W3WID7_9ACTN|nr:hypothetical protein [Streptomyces alkaliterrae]MBB1252916.1 hypothetical protein [Streptomyces alkaliterrae]
MSLFNRKTAETLDAAAKKLNHAGKRVGGERGGRVGDAIATAALGPLRRRCDASCTHNDCTHEDGAQ